MSELSIKRFSGGLFAKVFAIEADGEQFPVIMKQTSKGDPWVRYAKWVMSVRGRKVPGRQFIPEIMMISYSDNLSVMAIMKRYDATIETILRDCNKNRKFLEKHFDLTPDQAADIDNTAIMIADAFMRFHGAGRFGGFAEKFITKPFMKFKPKKSILDFVSFLRWLAKNKNKNGFFPNDVHTGNIMVDSEMNMYLTDPMS